MNEHRAIMNVLEDYFRGIYSGDVARLETAFHARAILAGDVDGQPYYKTVTEYLDVVRARKSPEALGEAYAMQIVSIEVHGKVALATVRCPILGFDYFDCLSLVRTGDGWKIVSKTFTNMHSTS